ncbi:PAS-domain containing protein [Schlegelella sp. ID0723]|uniref:PAS-domain containing protein n=2 Tax=Piscinibacter koreensis TaxID=2742824 RepID=A0A7Y6NR92_9BURK|nr:PAS-domain containing protein [Schlegelella koreensis]NUZ07860.1 PAS-domain containing protein [Schlegelella koreensis]
MLDGLELALCVFDEADRALLWNRTFLRFFPEHEGHVHVGEPYADNLRRFYRARLRPEEMGALERFVAEGVLRHRGQQRPFVFKHRGVELRAASLPLPGIGRARMWKVENRAEAASVAPAPSLVDGAERFRWLDHVADGVAITHPDGSIVWANDSFADLYGFAQRAAAIGLTFVDVYRSAWQGDLDADEERLYASGLEVLGEHLRYAGAPFEVPLPRERWSRVVEQSGPDGLRFFTHLDVTTMKHQQELLRIAEQRARESAALLELTLERMEQGVIMVNADGVVEVCNPQAMALLDLPEALMKSRPSFEQVIAYQWARDEFAPASEDLKAFIRAGGVLDRPHAYERQRPDGRVLEVRSVPIHGGGILRTYMDVTQRRRSEERIQHMARHDGLTTLINREAFLERLAEAARPPAGAFHGFAVLFIDLDGFKPINDQHGHHVGDKVLTMVASRLRAAAREGDVVGRMGGDEFAVLQRGACTRANALGLAQRILESVRQDIEVESHRVRVSASIGIAVAAEPGCDPDTLLRQADAAMYTAKARGRNQVQLHES